MKLHLALATLLLPLFLSAADGKPDKDKTEKKPAPKIIYGTASYYHDKFNGRQTANGEIFSQKKLTAALRRYARGCIATSAATPTVS